MSGIQNSDVLRVWNAKRKLEVLSHRFYAHQIEEAGEGKFYTLTRDGLELFKVDVIEGEAVLMLSLCDAEKMPILRSDSNPYEWDRDEFLEGGFAENRIYIPDWMIDSWISQDAATETV